MAQQEQSRWRPTRRQLLWAGAVAALIGYRYDITVWDWLKLLVVPAVIAGGGIWFNRQQRERELEIAREQRERETEIADQRARDEALQAYLDQMSTLLLEKNLRSSEEDSEVRTLARARTLTVLRRLDGERKGSVLKFLSESRLIDEEDPVLYLAGTDLLGASLIGGELRRAYLSGAYLSGAYLSGAYLIGAYLIGTNLSEANLSEAIGWTVEQLSQARSLEGATMPDGQKYEDWLKSKDGGEDGENPES